MINQQFTVNLERLVKNLPNGVNKLTPLVEAIVNSIDAIDERKKVENSFGDGEIILKINKISSLLKEQDIAIIDNIEIIDNGIGFISDNFDSFNELYSVKKIKIGGKGFGRITYLKYFKSVSIDSIYKENGTFRNKTFEFGNKGIFGLTDDEYILGESRYNTKIILKSPDKNFNDGIYARVETLARKLSEHLLGFLLEDSCPKIKMIISGDGRESSIILNDYIKSAETKVLEIGKENVSLPLNNSNLSVFVFKFYYPDNQKSAINLVAHKRVVLSNTLDKYIPEFQEEFYDEFAKKSGEGKKTENFVIKIYVKGQYLDECVNTERTNFNFPILGDKTMECIGREYIEKLCIESVKKYFPENLQERRKKKVEKIEKVVTEKFPWHKDLVELGTKNEESLNNIPANPSDEDIDIFFERLRFHREGEMRMIAKSILKGELSGDIKGEAEKLDKALLELNKSELAHYVSLRKIVLELYQRYLSFNEGNKYYKEEKIHNLIFPIGKNNRNIDYNQHNLWLLDENLVFSDFITSDPTIKAEDGKKTQPDILIFRDGDDKYSPIYIIELKRPGRTQYSNDPIDQIFGYVERLRTNDEITVNGRPIIVLPETPIYGYFIGDITERVKSSIKRKDATAMEEGESYYGYNKSLNVYFSVFSFDFIRKNSEKRNKIFFKQLGIDV